MKTVGEIIHSERLKKDLTVEKLSHLTKIDIKYLEAIERDDYKALPSETFAKGFIRNISLRLDRNPDELVAIFRRDYRSHEITTGNQKSFKVKKPRINLEFNHFFPYLIGLIVFVAYLVFQFRAVITPPELSVITPEKGAVVTSPVEISGTTDVGSTVSIDDSRVRPDENGNFSAKISLPLGETELSVKAVSRFGRSSTQKINFTVISK